MKGNHDHLKREKDIEKNLEPSMPAEDAAWARLLSGATQVNARDKQATDAVLNALKAERSGTQPVTQADWDRALSRASQLREHDVHAIQPALEAVRVARIRSRQRQLVLNRAFVGFAAAAVIAGALIVRTPNTSLKASADPGDAYAVYQEASQGW